MKNRLYYGDNLDVLRRKIEPASVDLCYIDPPFNSKRNYFQIYTNQGGEDRAQAQAFVDTWEWGPEADAGLAWICDIERLNTGALTEQTVALVTGLEGVLGRGGLFAYVVSLTLRVAEIHRVLKPTGSFYLHCDPTASHYLKLVCDAVFCGQGGEYLSEISWRRSSAHNDARQGRKQPGNIRDVVLLYTKSRDWLWNWQYTAYTQDYIARNYRHKDLETGRMYRLDNLTAAKPGGDVSYQFRGTSPYKGRYWAYSRENMERFYEDGRLYFPANGGTPAYKRYLDEMPGVPLQNDWNDIQPPQGSEYLGYPTQKPEALLERIIRASSNEGDTVLDAYCGCGTTVAVAQRLNRRWIGIDITYQSIAVILDRLATTYKQDWPAIEANTLLDGVPRDLESAKALANRKDDRTRKEFEKWAILTFSKNKARINEKKGADGGIDGIAYFVIDAATNGKAIFQVKSGKTGRADLATLNSDRLKAKAEFGFLIAFDMPTKAMRDEIMAAGKYKYPLYDRDDDRLQVITVAELFAPHNRRLDLPLARDAVKAAATLGDAAAQDTLL